MAITIAGAAAVISGGSSTANATMASTAERPITTSGDDSSTTGSSVQADIVHTGLSSRPIASATEAGNRSGTQNAIAASRRSGAVGLIMSASAGRLGRLAASASKTGITA